MAAAEEERFSRDKHDHRFPQQAIEYCLEEGGISPAELDLVAFYDKPLLKFERLLETYLAYAPAGFRSFLAAIPLWVRQKLHLPREMDRGLGGGYEGRYVFPEHHQSHAAAAFFPSPFEQAAILTFDGVGEWATASYGIGRGNRVELSHELRFPHSLGLLYSAFTYFCGFRVNSGEHKLMGLAPYGEPRYVDLILDRLVDLKADGSFRMDMSHFNYCQGLTMTGRKFERLFGGPPRRPESPLTRREMDMAASVQAVTEEVILRAARHVARQTEMRNLVMAGGCALNCVANGRLLAEGIYDDLWVQPASSDAGGALGAALFTWHQLLDRPREVPDGRDRQQGSLLGPAFGNGSARAFLDRVGAVYEAHEEEDRLLEEVVRQIASGKVVGYFHGRMEFGPRALGCRSILGDARSPRMQSILNRKIKFRESFRPFAPSVLKEEVHRWFTMPAGQDSPYMLLVAAVRPEHRLSEPGKREEQGEIGRRLNVTRSTIPAVTHVDYSARVQTVDPERHSRYYRLVKLFAEQTGCPVLVNTSFNVRGEPIVCTPENAYDCFMASNMDVLVLENNLLYKDRQPSAEHGTIDQYMAQFDAGKAEPPLIRLNWNPQRRQLRNFGLICLVAFGALGTWAWLGRSVLGLGLGHVGAAVLWAVGGGSAVLAMAWPQALRPLFVGLSLVAFPIGLIVSHLLLTLLYYGVITPVGLVRRALGRDPLQRELDPAAHTYWARRDPPPDKSRYFRQF